MAETTALPVPQTLTATYVLPAAPDDGDEAARQALLGMERHLALTALAMLDGGLLQVSVHPAAELPALPVELLEVFGATPEQLAALTGAERSWW